MAGENCKTWLAIDLCDCWFTHKTSLSMLLLTVGASRKTESQQGFIRREQRVFPKILSRAESSIQPLQYHCIAMYSEMSVVIHKVCPRAALHYIRHAVSP